MGFSFAELKIKSCQTQRRIYRAQDWFYITGRFNIFFFFLNQNPSASLFLFFSPCSSWDKILALL
jgi:hypothetical protein